MKKKYDFYCEEALSWKTKIIKLYESEKVLAFYHTRPSYKKHIVIVPKKHIFDLSSFEDDDLETISEIMIVARDLSKNLDKDLWIRLITNMWKYQDTPHIHFHLVEWKQLKNVME